MSERMCSQQISPSKPFSGQEKNLIQKISALDFKRWLRETEKRENIEQGKAYYNNPAPVPPPEKHIPSSLLQCHRKLFYQQQNAPSESETPRGIFRFGTYFEEGVILPYLRETVPKDELYVTNSLYVNFEEETDGLNLKISGSTDPVVVDVSGTPVLPTEIKTKSSVEHLEEPDRHHRAQIHAYLVGLSKEYDTDLNEGLIIYGGRDSFNLRAFHIQFDEDFWSQQVAQWAATHTSYRLQNKLPPATPEFGWECNFCDYRDRCGKGEYPDSDAGAVGLLPNYDNYPIEQLVKYLEAHDAKLLPTLAQSCPDLCERYGVEDWYCRRCTDRVAWEPSDRQSKDSDRICPTCAKENRIEFLGDPALALQEPNKPAEVGQ